MAISLSDFISDSDLPDPPLELLPDPMLWRVLVRPFVPKRITSGGTILPDSVVDANALYNIQARVLKVGPLCFRDHQTGKSWDPPVELKEGDLVTIGKFAGQKVEIGKLYYYIINCEEITSRFPAGQNDKLREWVAGQELLAKQAREALRQEAIALQKKSA